ncbi:MAG: FG-GAP-like repeat-containing protein [Polyangiaceae bacterium]
MLRSLVLQDCDGDDDLDVLVLGYGDPLGNSSVLAVHRNDGDGDFSNASGNPIGVSLPAAMAVGNFDGLGGVDVAAVFEPFMMPTLELLAGDGACGFSSVDSRSLAGTPRSIVAGFFDGDGRADLVIAVDGPPFLQVLMTETSPNLVIWPASVASMAMVAAQLNGNAPLDLAYVDFAGDAVLFREGGGGTFGGEVPSPLPAGSGSLAMAAADMTGDGVVDVVTANRDTSSVSVLENNGNGAFAAVGPAVDVGGQRPTAIALGDVDADGDVDVLTSNTQSTSLSVLLNDGDGGLVLWAAPLDAKDGAPNATLADVNDDGALDLVWTTQTTDTPGRLWVLLAKP